jgi:hypothetical protein
VEERDSKRESRESKKQKQLTQKTQDANIPPLVSTPKTKIRPLDEQDPNILCMTLGEKNNKKKAKAKASLR